MKNDQTKLKKELANFDENSDYYIALIPDKKSIDKTMKILDNQKDFLAKDNLDIRTADYLHMTAIYLPALNKINQELSKINISSKLSKEKLVEFIKKLIYEMNDNENYIINKVGYLGKRSISLWMNGNTPPIFVKSIAEFKKLIINSGLSDNEFEKFVDRAKFSTLKHYRGQEFLPHISIIKVPDYVNVSEDILQKLSKLYKNMEIKINKIELRKNG